MIVMVRRRQGSIVMNWIDGYPPPERKIDIFVGSPRYYQMYVGFPIQHGQAFTFGRRLPDNTASKPCREEHHVLPE